MSQTRQSSAAKMIKLLQKADNIQTPNLEKQFKKIEALLAADPSVIYEMVEVTIDGIDYTLSPLQYNCGTLDSHFLNMFFASAARSDNMVIFDEQVTQYDWSVDTNLYFQEYDSFYVEYETMKQSEKTDEEISAVAVEKLGSAQRNYPRSMWDDITQMRAFAAPVFTYVINGKNIADMTGADIIGENYYVLSCDTLNYDEKSRTYYGVPMITATDQLPKNSNDIITQRDRLLGYLQARVEVRDGFFLNARLRKNLHVTQEALRKLTADKENTAPTMHN